MYFLCRAILGKDRLIERLHLPLCEHLEDPYPKKGVCIPRGWYKSTIASVAYPIWCLIRDSRDTVLIVAITATLARRFLAEIKEVFESNEIFRWLFPEIIPDFSKVKWTVDEIEIQRPLGVREPSIAAIGVGGTSVGNHFRRVIKEDFVDESNVDSAEQIEQICKWDRTSVSLLVEPTIDTEVFIGTRWGFNDFLSYVKENRKNVHWFEMSAENTEGEPLFPERFGREVLDEIKEIQGPYIYSCQYGNRPIDPSRQVFRPEWCPTFQWNEDVVSFVANSKMFAILDPALSEKKHGSWSGYVLCAVGPGYQTLVLKGIKRRWNVDDYLDNIFADAMRFPGLAVGVEMASLMKVLKWPLEREMFRRQQFIGLQVLEPSTQISKEGRARAMVPFFSRFLFKFLTNECEDLLKDIRIFPFGDKNWDALDALSYLPQMWSEGRGIPEPPKYDPMKDPFNMAYIMNELRGPDPTRSEGPLLKHRFLSPAERN